MQFVIYQETEEMENEIILIEESKHYYKIFMKALDNRRVSSYFVS